MITSLTTLAANPVPAYCGNLVKTPAQWKACWNAGWSQPTTGAANAGGFAGHYFGPVLIVLAVVALVCLLGSRRSAATSS